MNIMYCPGCGNQVTDSTASCPHCGYSIAERQAAQQPVPSASSSMALAVLSIVFGAVAFIFCPPGLGAAGLICGIIEMRKRHPETKVLATVGVVVSAIAIPVGILLGVLVWSAVSH